MFWMHDTIFQTDNYFLCCCSMAGENIDFQHNKTVHVAFIFNTAINRPRMPFLFEKRPELKNWYLGWFGRLEFETLRYHPRIVSTLSRHYHLIRQHIVPAGSGLLFSSKSNRIKKLINRMIRTGADLIYSDSSKNRRRYTSSLRNRRLFKKSLFCDN